MIKRRSAERSSFSDNNVDWLIRYIRNAARLRLEISPLEKDRENTAKGITISYAADTNLLHLYVAPYRMGPRSSSGGGGGYGLVFHDDTEESAKALGAAISRFALYSLTGERPLLLLPGHDVEARLMYDERFLAWKRAREEAGTQRERIQSALKDLVARRDIEDPITWVECNAAEFFNYLFGDVDSPRAEFTRLNRLLSDRRIMRLAAAVARARAKQAGFQPYEHPAFSASTQLHSVIEESVYRSTWREMLKQADDARPRMRHKPERSLQHDSAALARLELINRDFATHRLPQRLVLISGDEVIGDAAAQYEPDWLPEGGNFASLYLRHPRAFLSVPDVLRPPGELSNVEGVTPIVDWLDMLLANYGGWHVPDEAMLRKITFPGGISKRHVYHALSVNPDASRLQRDWRKYTAELRDAHSAVSTIARAEIRRVFHEALAEDVYSTLESLDRQFIQITEETWKTFFHTLMSVGYDLVEDRERRGRNPPPISFGSFHKTSHFVRQVMSAEITAVNFEDLVEALDDDGGTGYSRALAYAVLFACSGRWGVAVQIAQRAIEIAERVRSEVEERTNLAKSVDPRHRAISGREAYYFKAATQRLLARSADDLADVDTLLQSARDALVYDNDRDDSVQPSDLRFRAEAAAIKFTRYLFARFSDTESANGTADSAANLLNAFMVVLDDAPIEPDHWLRYNVERNIFTNIFMVAAVCEADNDLNEERSLLFRKYAGQFIAHIRHPYIDVDVPVTRLVESVANYALARFGHVEKDDKRKILDAVNTLENGLDTDPDSITVMPYDRQRFGLLVSLTRKAMSRLAR